MILINEEQEKRLLKNFASWIVDYRTQNNELLSRLAEIVGIDAKSIGRYETCEQMPLFETLALFCMILNQDPELYWQRIFKGITLDIDIPWGEYRPNRPTLDQTLTSEDIAHLHGIYNAQSHSCISFIAHLLAHRQYIAFPESTGQTLDIDSQTQFYLETLTAMGEDASPVRVALSLDDQLALGDIDQLFLQGGFFSTRDVGQYIQFVRQEKKHKLTHFAQKTGVAAGSIRRYEAGTANRIRIIDILRVVQGLDDGRIIPMYWLAFANQHDINQSLSSKKISNTMPDYLLDIVIQAFRAPETVYRTDIFHEYLTSSLSMLRSL